jgi:hypothetical protein
VTHEQLQKQHDAFLDALDSIKDLYEGDWSDKYRDENMAGDMADIARVAIANVKETRNE